jgi:plastocyanin
MVGILEVVAKDSDRKTPEKIAAEAQAQSSSIMTTANSAPKPTVTSGTAAAGWADAGPVAINEFYPKQLTVKSGTKVTWKDFSSYEPHTVTFGATRPKSGGPGAFLAPSGLPSGSVYSTGLANSGIFGGDISKATFSLTFNTPGTYSYQCMLHPGMVGSVKVT